MPPNFHVKLPGFLISFAISLPPTLPGLHNSNVLFLIALGVSLDPVPMLWMVCNQAGPWPPGWEGKTPCWCNRTFEHHTWGGCSFSSSSCAAPTVQRKHHPLFVSCGRISPSSGCRERTVLFPQTAQCGALPGGLSLISTLLSHKELQGRFQFGD